jgi:hypothetical protein
MLVLQLLPQMLLVALTLLVQTGCVVVQPQLLLHLSANQEVAGCLQQPSDVSPGSQNVQSINKTYS